MLRQRLLTALVLVPFAVWGVLMLPAEWFRAVMAALVGMAAWEWARLGRLDAPRQQVAYVLIVLAAVGLTAVGLAWNPRTLQLLLGAGLAWWLLSLGWIARFPRCEDLWVVRPGPRLLAGVLVLVVSWAAVVGLREHPYHGPAALLFLLALVWVADSAAYFAGRRWGRRKLAPAVSPGKTWAGAYGAFGATLAVGLLGALLLHLPPQRWMGFLMLCEVTVAFSILGDLLESLFKRCAGVKDSSALLPGHGGLLDRVDSLLAAAPVFLLGLLLLEIRT